MIVVTGGVGFIGSRLVKQLNAKGYTDILVVDDLTDGTKFTNIADCDIIDYLDKDIFIERIKQNPSLNIQAIFHQGACSSTTEWDGKWMMNNNYEYSKILLDYCQQQAIPFLYASSAAVYGLGENGFKEEKACETPLNVYGYSKLLFDQYVRRCLPTSKSQIAGFRYFNVYGPNEQHKGSMASVAYHLNEQLKVSNSVKLFEGTEGYANGEQKRDFVYVDDVVDVNIWFLEHPEHSGIFNVGTGKSQTFNEVARAVIDYHKKGQIDYIPFPKHLNGRYQNFTQADMTALESMGYDAPFKDVQKGVKAYLSSLKL